MRELLFAVLKHEGCISDGSLIESRQTGECKHNMIVKFMYCLELWLWLEYDLDFA